MGVFVKRIIVTGMGVVSPLGCGVQHVWRSLLAGESEITRLSERLAADIPCKVAGQVPSIDSDPLYSLNPLATAPAKERRKMDRFIEFVLVAAREALAQTGWSPASEAEQECTATVTVTEIGGFSEVANAIYTTDERGPRCLSPFAIPSFLASLAVRHVSIAHGFRGPIGVPVTACTAGAQAIGNTTRMIHSGEADIALYGGAEAAVHRTNPARFTAARALSSASSDQPEAAPRPFDHDRDGLMMGEDAGLIMIKSLEHALARGATPLAELVGYSTSADAYHLTAGPEDGNGTRRAMEATIRQAGVTVGEIDHINAHATSMQVGDRDELAAIKTLFDAHPVAITSTESTTGHLLGAVGGVEAVFAIQTLHNQMVPPALNLHRLDEEAAGLNLVALQVRPQKIRYTLSNGFGFDGVNVSLLLERWE